MFGSSAVGNQNQENQQQQYQYQHHNFGFQFPFNYLKLCINISPKSQHVVYLKVSSYWQSFLEEINLLLPNINLEHFRLYWIDSEDDKVDIFGGRTYHTFLEIDKKQYRKIFLEHVKVYSSREQQSSTRRKVNPTVERQPQFQQYHNGVTCDGCNAQTIIGFRYKCIQCADFDLCEKCEQLKKHKNHVMLRLPTALENIPFNCQFLKKLQNNCIINENGLSNIYNKLQQQYRDDACCEDKEIENSTITSEDYDDDDKADCERSKKCAKKEKVIPKTNKRNKKGTTKKGTQFNCVNDLLILNKKFSEMSKLPTKSSDNATDLSFNNNDSNEKQEALAVTTSQMRNNLKKTKEKQQDIQRKSSSYLEKFFEDFRNEETSQCNDLQQPSAETAENSADQNGKEITTEWTLIENDEDRNLSDINNSERSCSSKNGEGSSTNCTPHKKESPNNAKDDAGLVTDMSSSIAKNDKGNVLKLTLAIEEDYSLDVNSVGDALNVFRRNYNFAS